jgi:hypothetical protein
VDVKVFHLAEGPDQVHAYSLDAAFGLLGIVGK